MSHEACTVRFTAMASACEIHLAGADEAVLRHAAELAIGEVRRIEGKYSRYRSEVEGSIVAAINASAGSTRAIELDDETASLLDFADQLHAQSDGLFDITSGVLRRAWNFRSGAPPAAAELDALLPLVGWSQVQRDARRVRLPRAGMELDFGGFGKEYAADRAATLLMAQRLGHGFVNLGGDIRIVGPREDGSAWRLGIQHAREVGATVASVELAQGALATSGDYERFFIHDGRRYCHVLDPRTGWPVSAWQSISVALPACVAAGALSTIAMLKGDGALAFLDQQQAAYLAIDALGHRFHNSL